MNRECETTNVGCKAAGEPSFCQTSRIHVYLVTDLLNFKHASCKL